VKIRCLQRKIWSVASRFGGKHEMLSGGIYPDTSFAQALAWLDSSNTLIFDGEVEELARLKNYSPAHVSVIKLGALPA
jgi:hypothetical protein